MAFRLVVGLGNDDEKYRSTFHNVGEWAVRELASRRKLPGREAGRNVVYQDPLSGAVLARPRSLMNVCGPCVKDVLMKAGGDPSTMMVVSDDFMLPEGRLRLRREGSSGGHNGLKSVIETLGAEGFPRLRIGVGPVPEGTDPADYVLRRVPADRLAAWAAKAADALEVCLSEGLDAAMNRFNSGGEPPGGK